MCLPRRRAASPSRRRVVGRRFIVSAELESNTSESTTGAAVIPGTTGEAGWGGIELRAAVIPGTTGEAGWGDIELRRRRNEEGGVRLVVVLPVVMPMGRRRSKWNAKGSHAVDCRVQRGSGFEEASASLLR